MKNSNKGFIAIIVAVFAPVILSLFYLYMRDSFSTTNKSVTDTATQEAALEAARNYYDERFINFDKQSEFLDRKTSTAFSSVMKSLVGISQNIFTFEQQKIGYISERYTPDNVVHNLERLWLYKTPYDADCDVLDSIISSAEYLIRNDSANEVEHFVLKRKNTADNLLSISKIDEDVLRVETEITLQRGFGQTHRYKSSYKATAPKCNVDIVLGIPTNYATCTVENRNYPTIQGAPEKTPISEISRALRRFVKRLLPVRKCAIGVVPYSGSVSFYGNQPMKAHKAEELDEKTLSIPVYNSYAYLCKESGDKLDSKYLSSKYGVTGVMLRDELLYDNALYDLVDSTTKFHVFPTSMCHSGDASVASGFCKMNSEFRPNLYPILGLTEDKLKVYRFLGLLSPHNADEKHKSSFTYLPIMFGASMLKGTYVPPESPYRSNSAAKKVAIIIANEADKFKPGELTYFGFNNDAAHVSMIEGDKIDFEKGNLVKTEDGYFANTAENNIYGKYYKKMRLKTSYTPSDPTRITTGDVIIPSKQNMRFIVSSMPSVLIYKQNGHFDDVSIVQVSSPKNTVIIDRGAYYQCHVPKRGTSISVQYSGDRPVLVKMELYECEIKGGQDPMAHTIRQDPNFVYVCRQAGGDVPGIVTMEFETATITHDWPALSYFKDQLIDGTTADSSIIRAGVEDNIQVCNINLEASADFKIKGYTINGKWNSFDTKPVELTNLCKSPVPSSKCNTHECTPWYAMRERCMYYSDNPPYYVSYDNYSSLLSSDGNNSLESAVVKNIKIGYNLLQGKTAKYDEDIERWTDHVTKVNGVLSKVTSQSVFKSARGYVVGEICNVLTRDKEKTSAIYKRYIHSGSGCEPFKSNNNCLLCDHLNKFNDNVDELFKVKEEWKEEWIGAFGRVEDNKDKKSLDACIQEVWANGPLLLGALGIANCRVSLSVDETVRISGSTQNVIAEHALRNINVMKLFANNRILQLRSEINNLEHIREQLGQQYDDKIIQQHHDLADKEAELEAAKQALEKAKAALAGAEAALEEAKAALKEAEDALKTKKDELKDADEALKNMEKERAKALDVLKEKQRAKADAEKEKKQAEAALKDAEKERAKAEKELQNLNLQIEQLEKDIDNASNAAERKFNERIDKKKIEYKELEKYYKYLIVQANNAIRKLKFTTFFNLLAKAFDVSRKKDSKATEIFFDLIFKPFIVLNYERSIKQQLEARKNELEALANQKRRIIDRLNEIIRGYTSAVDAAEREIEKSSKQISDQKKVIEGIENEIAEQKEKINDIKTEIIEQQKKRDRLQDNIEERKEVVNERKQEVAYAQKEIGWLKEYINTLRGELDKLGKDIADALAVINKVCGEKETQQVELNKVLDGLSYSVSDVVQNDNYVLLTLKYGVGDNDTVEIPMFIELTSNDINSGDGLHFYNCENAREYCNKNSQGCHMRCLESSPYEATIALPNGEDVAYYSDVTLHIKPPSENNFDFLAGGARAKGDERFTAFSDFLSYPPTYFTINYYGCCALKQFVKKHAFSLEKVVLAEIGTTSEHADNKRNCDVLFFPKTDQDSDALFLPKTDQDSDEDESWRSKWINDQLPYFVGSTKQEGNSVKLNLCNHYNDEIKTYEYVIKLGDVYPGNIIVSSDQIRFGMVKVYVTALQHHIEQYTQNPTLITSYNTLGFTPSVINIKTEHVIEEEMHEKIKVGEKATLSLKIGASESREDIETAKTFDSIQVSDIKVITLEPQQRSCKRKMKMAQQYPYVRIYKSNPLSTTTIKQVQCQEGGVIVESEEGDYVDCFIKGDSAGFLIILSESDPDIPVLCMLDMYSCDIESSNQCVMQDSNYVYLCSNSDETTCNITVKRINSDVEQIQHPTLSFCDGKPVDKDITVDLSYLHRPCLQNLFNSEKPVDKDITVDLSHSHDHCLQNLFNVKSTIHGAFSIDGYASYKATHWYANANNETIPEGQMWFSLIGRYKIPVYFLEHLVDGIASFIYVDNVTVTVNGEKYEFPIGERASSQGVPIEVDIPLYSGGDAKTFDDTLFSPYDATYEFAETREVSIQTIEKHGINALSYSGDMRYCAAGMQDSITADFKTAMAITKNVEFKIEVKIAGQQITSTIRIGGSQAKSEARDLLEPLAYYKYGVEEPSPQSYFEKIVISPNINLKREFKSVLSGKIQFTDGVSNQPTEYPIDGGVTQIFVPKDHITSEKISFTLTDAYLSSIEWCNALETEGNVYSERINDETATKRRRNADRFEDLKAVVEQEDPEDVFDDEKLKPVRIKYRKPPELKYSRLLDLSARILKNNFLNTLQHVSFMDSVMYSEQMYYPGGHLLQNSKKTKFEITKVVDALSEYYENDYDDIDSGDMTLIADNFFNEPQMYVFNGEKAGYLNGLNRFFYQHKYGKENVFATSSNSANQCPSRLKTIEATYPVNRILEKWCNQSVEAGVLSRSGTQIMRDEVSVEASKMFNREFGRNGRLYLIKYRCTPENSKALSKLNAYKIYTANNEQQLDSALQKIMADIEQFANYSDAKIVN